VGLRQRDNLLLWLHNWHKAEVWQNLYEVFVVELNGADQPDWLRGSVDSRPFRAPFPVRGKPSRPRRRPREVYADASTNLEPRGRRLPRRVIRLHIARRKTHESGLGRF
jgi:hypothetical protein